MSGIWGMVGSAAGLVGSAASYVGDSVYAAGQYAGVISSEPVVLSIEQVAHPSRTINTVDEAVAFGELNHATYLREIDHPGWELLPWQDATGGDTHLFTRPSEGRYAFIKATLSINAPVKAVLELTTSPLLSERQRFSSDIEDVKIMETFTKEVNILRCRFWAPPPVSSRDFVFLQTIKELEDGTVVVSGCSVENDKCEDEGYVRGICFWGWRFMPVGEKTLVSYFNCSDPRGWCPSFLNDWIKTAVGREMCNIRAVCQGEMVACEKETFTANGVSQEEIDREIAAAKATGQLA